MSGTKVAVVRRVWYAMIDGRISERVAAETARWEDRIADMLTGMEQRLGARMDRVEQNLLATRAELKADIGRVEQNLLATRTELKEDIGRVEQNLWPRARS